ncbi:hypothetical protein ACFVYT_06380 [Streptomyces sp. NPDC058290]|uniref:hypothetical protein n=1 Tax=Streptomyces sp. NPDC058290 TaxID=3346426 RepID=UPI0036E14A87
MTDPVALAATQGDGPREFPDATGAATPTSAEPIRTPRAPSRPPQPQGLPRPQRPQ